MNRYGLLTLSSLVLFFSFLFLPPLASSSIIYSNTSVSNNSLHPDAYISVIDSMIYPPSSRPNSANNGTISTATIGRRTAAREPSRNSSSVPIHPIWRANGSTVVDSTYVVPSQRVDPRADGRKPGVRQNRTTTAAAGKIKESVAEEPLARTWILVSFLYQDS